MSLVDAIEAKEKSIIELLRVQQMGIDHNTGKGSSVERIVEDELLRPNLPRNFDICKDAVVGLDNLNQSKQIDRIIYDTSISGPLIYSPDHSIFPIEAVCGLVEITLHMNSKKLRNDIEHIASVNNTYIRKYFYVPKYGTSTGTIKCEADYMTPRSFIIGFSENNKWDIKKIAKCLHDSQKRVGEPLHIHGLYVIGTGYFETSPRENKSDLIYEIKACTEITRLLCFANRFRIAFQRWYELPKQTFVNIEQYHNVDMKVIVKGTNKS